MNAKGELAGEFAFGGEGAQARLLQADGIAVVDGRVDLKSMVYKSLFCCVFRPFCKNQKPQTMP